jgi:hypothetical protein
MWQSKREIYRECNDKIGSAKGSQIKWGRGKGQMFTLKQGRGGGIYVLNETSACGGRFFL